MLKRQSQNKSYVHFHAVDAKRRRGISLSLSPLLETTQQHPLWVHAPLPPKQNKNLTKNKELPIIHL
jgi:hypothetical protein